MRLRNTFAFLVLTFLVLRLGTLLTSVEYLSSWQTEELYRGTIAKELIEGLKAPLWHYQADHYDGGSLWIGVLAVPFFLLLGPNLFALKLVPLLFFSLPTFILTFFFFKKFFDRKTALFVSTLLVLPPPVFTALSLTAIGSEPESVFFTSAMLFSFYQFMYGEKKRTVSLILFGLLSGLGFWFTSITFLTLLACLISWFLLDRRSFLSKKILVFSGAFLVGCLPFILYNLTHHFGFLRLLVQAFLWQTKPYDSWGEAILSALREKLVLAPAKMFTLIFKTFPMLFYFRPFLKIPAQWLTFSYGFTAWFLIALFIGQEGRRLFPLLKDSLREGRIAPEQIANTKSFPFLIFLFLFILIYTATTYSPLPFNLQRSSEFRYFCPLYYFLFSLLGMSLYRQKRSGFYLSVFLTLGLLGQGSLLFNEPPGNALKYRGYSYSHLGYTWGQYLFRFPEEFDRFSSLAERFKASERRSLYWGLSMVMASFRMKEDTTILWKSILRVPSDYRKYFLEDWGRHLSAFREKEFDRNLALGSLISEEEQPYFYYGLATKIPLGLPHRAFYGAVEVCPPSIQKLTGSFPRSYYYFKYFKLGRSFYCALQQGGGKEAAIEIPDSIGRREKIWIYRGMGAEAAAIWLWSMDFNREFDRLAAKLSPKAQAEFFWGIGWGLPAEYVGEDRLRALDWLHRLQRDTQPWAWKGFQTFERWYQT